MSDTALTEKNRAIIDDMYKCVASADLEGTLTFWADDVVVEEPPFLPWGGTYRGKEQISAVLRDVLGKFDLTKITVHYTVADQDRVAACVSIPALATGKSVNLMEQSTLQDGKIVHMKIFYYDPSTFIKSPETD